MCVWWGVGGGGEAGGREICSNFENLVFSSMVGLFTCRILGPVSWDSWKNFYVSKQNNRL